MASNICLIVNRLSFYEFVLDVKGANDNFPIFWILMIVINGFIQVACFNVSHWMFAFLYYKISRFMPYVLKGQVFPEKKLKCDESINNVMLFLNIALPLLNYLLVFLGDWVYGHTGANG